MREGVVKALQPPERTPASPPSPFCFLPPNCSAVAVGASAGAVFTSLSSEAVQPEPKMARPQTRVEMAKSCFILVLNRSAKGGEVEVGHKQHGVAEVGVLPFGSRSSSRVESGPVHGSEVAWSIDSTIHAAPLSRRISLNRDLTSAMNPLRIGGIKKHVTPCAVVAIAGWA
jgi:hypothetical protein